MLFILRGFSQGRVVSSLGHDSRYTIILNIIVIRPQGREEEGNSRTSKEVREGLERTDEGRKHQHRITHRSDLPIIYTIIECYEIVS